MMSDYHALTDLWPPVIHDGHSEYDAVIAKNNLHAAAKDILKPSPRGERYLTCINVNILSSEQLGSGPWH